MGCQLSVVYSGDGVAAQELPLLLLPSLTKGSDCILLAQEKIQIHIQS